MRNSKKVMLSSVIASLLLVGCGNGSSSTNVVSSETTASDTRFTTMLMDGETVEVDSMKKVQWIGSVGKNQNACQPHAAAATESADIEGANAHCSQLVFATYADWRVATPAEHKEHITAMNTAGKTPFYANPACPRVIGVEATKATAVNTHNSTPIGAETSWEDLINSTASNYGVKCIRDVSTDTSVMP